MILQTMYEFVFVNSCVSIKCVSIYKKENTVNKTTPDNNFVIFINHLIVCLRQGAFFLSGVILV